MRWQHHQSGGGSSKSSEGFGDVSLSRDSPDGVCPTFTFLPKCIVAEIANTLDRQHKAPGKEQPVDPPWRCGHLRSFPLTLPHVHTPTRFLAPVELKNCFGKSCLNKRWIHTVTVQSFEKLATCQTPTRFLPPSGVYLLHKWKFQGKSNLDKMDQLAKLP